MYQTETVSYTHLVGDTISIKDEKDGNKDIVIQNICENYMGHYLYQMCIRDRIL